MRKKESWIAIQLESSLEYTVAFRNYPFNVILNHLTVVLSVANRKSISPTQTM